VSPREVPNHGKHACPGCGPYARNLQISDAASARVRLLGARKGRAPVKGGREAIVT